MRQSFLVCEIAKSLSPNCIFMQCKFCMTYLSVILNKVKIFEKNNIVAYPLSARF